MTPYYLHSSLVTFGLVSNIYNSSKFTIHGLWPNYAEPGKWPAFCNSSYPFNEKEIEDLLPEMDENWPDMLNKQGSQKSIWLWTHEWEKHGTCATPVLKVRRKGKGLSLLSSVSLFSLFSLCSLFCLSSVMDDGLTLSIYQLYYLLGMYHSLTEWVMSMCWLLGCRVSTLIFPRLYL